MYALTIEYKKDESYELISYELYQKDFLYLFTDIICRYNEIYLMEEEVNKSNVCTVPELKGALKMAVMCDHITEEGLADSINFYVGNYRFVVHEITETFYSDYNYHRHSEGYPDFHH